MIKTTIKTIAAVAVLSIASAAWAQGANTLSRTGSRTKFPLGTLYDLTLTIPAALDSASAKTLVETNAVMTISLEIKSGMVTRERFVDTTTDGFKNAEKSGYTTPNTELFLKQFDGIDFKKGAIVTMKASADGTLETLFKGGAKESEKTLGTIADPALKKALFAIWLGENPAQDSLKERLLGGKKK